MNQFRPHLAARSTWGAVFGVVPDRGLRRRPSEVARIGVGAALLAVGAAAAQHLSRWESVFRDLVTALPGPLLDALEVLNGAGSIIALLVVATAALVSRRIRFIGSVLVAAGLALGLGRALQAWVDAPGAMAAAGVTPYPAYPTLRLAVLAAVFYVAAPELTRPARRLQWALLVLVAISVVAVNDGYPGGIIGSLALGWAVAALVHLAFGSPDGIPDPASIRAEAAELGVELGDLEPSAVQVWGEHAFESTDAGGPVRVVVIGRDATDAQFLAKAVRFLWYKDSGPTVAFTRPQQIQRRAYLLLLAERAGLLAPRVVASGSVGGRHDAVLLLRATRGRPLDALAPDELTDDVLTAAWELLGRLHALGLSHQALAPNALTLGHDGSVGFVDLATSDTTPSDDALLADRAALLVVTAALTDDDRAVAAARQALGDDGVTEVLPLLQAGAMPRQLQRSVPDARHLVARLRDRVAGDLGVEPPALVQLQRVSVSNILMAAGAILGVYLLIGQLSEVDFATVFDDAQWVWVPVIALFSQLPQIGNSIAMLGSVHQPMPLRPVVGVNFANQFTGLVGGSVANAALNIRFFQRQGMTAAVAVSSGVLVSVAAAVVQATLVVVGLLVVGDTFSWSGSGDSGSSDGSSGSQTFITVLIVVAVVVVVAVFVPRIRRRIGQVLVPQLHAARDNLAAIVKDPRKGMQLFGGNFVSQLFFALTLWAALECYGESLGILQLIVINSFASVLGGIMPVPGGMGVIEAGLIGGFTAAGVPEDQAVAATFTARLFTAYLPPIWGWFALQWLRRSEYV